MSVKLYALVVSLALLAGTGLVQGQDVPATPDNGGPRRFEVTAVGGLNQRAAPSTAAASVGGFSQGDIVHNLGCQRAESRIWCEVQKLGGGAVGYVAAEYLQTAVGPDGAPAMGPDDSALRAGQGDFDATGNVPCAQVAGQPTTQCEFGVARAGSGDATLVVTRPDGRKRALYFIHGVAIGADTAESEGMPEFSARKQSDLHFVSVGDERYEIPDAAILGG